MYYNEFKVELIGDLVSNISSKTAAVVTSMVSSLKTNMPTVEGVFPEGKQPNMPKKMKEIIAAKCINNDDTGYSSVNLW